MFSAFSCDEEKLFIKTCFPLYFCVGHKKNSLVMYILSSQATLLYIHRYYRYLYFLSFVLPSVVDDLVSMRNIDCGEKEVISDVTFT